MDGNPFFFDWPNRLKSQAPKVRRLGRMERMVSPRFTPSGAEGYLMYNLTAHGVTWRIYRKEELGALIVAGPDLAGYFTHVPRDLSLDDIFGYIGLLLDPQYVQGGRTCGRRSAKTLPEYGTCPLELKAVEADQ